MHPLTDDTHAERRKYLALTMAGRLTYPEAGMLNFYQNINISVLLGI